MNVRKLLTTVAVCMTVCLMAVCLLGVAICSVINEERAAQGYYQDVPVDGHWWSPRADLETYYDVPPAPIKLKGQPGFTPQVPGEAEAAKQRNRALQLQNEQLQLDVQELRREIKAEREADKMKMQPRMRWNGGKFQRNQW